VPRIAYVNKMDIMGADFFNVIAMMKDRLKANPVPIQLPIGAEETFAGMVDLIDMNAIVYDDELGRELERVPIPEDMKEIAANTTRSSSRRRRNTTTTCLRRFRRQADQPRGAHCRDAQGDHRAENRAGYVRFVLPQQGRAAPAGCDRGFHALAA
jgi:translation elongation factor EF-G